MTHHSPAVAISDTEYRLHKSPRFLRFLSHDQYPRDPDSGRPVTEFVALADACAELGLAILPHSQIEERLRHGLPVLKFGPTDIAADLALLQKYPPRDGEWNCRNLETISGFDRDLSVKRPRSVGRASPRPTLPTVGPFGSRSESIDLLARPGSWSQCAPDLASRLSVNRHIHRIQAVTPNGTTMFNDEWRHHIYRRELISSTPAFDCDPQRTNPEGRARNI